MALLLPFPIQAILLLICLQVDLQDPLISDDENLIQAESSEVTRECGLKRACDKTEGLLQQSLPSSSPLDESIALSNDGLVENDNNQAEVLANHLQPDLENNPLTEQRWCSLEVIDGPSSGLQHAVRFTSTSKLPVKLGRVVSSSDLLLKDPAVSAKHAQIDYNSNKWKLVDMGSLNGTFLNSQLVSHPVFGSRKWGNSVELASGDIITLGITSKVNVCISSKNEFQSPFSFGVASDPMALYRGGRQLPMEDVCNSKWPLSEDNKFGVFCVCDGYGGARAAQASSNIIPEVLESILSDSVRKENVLSQSDARDVLHDVLAETEARLDYDIDEGCTATVLLVWKDSEGNIFAQCANLGDSACVMSLDGRSIQMTEDHRVASLSERNRIEEAGLSLRDGETRINGINLARMLGAKFAKNEDRRFSAEPYISEPLRISKSSKDVFAVLASDGLWDVVSPDEAVELVVQMREKEENDSAEKIANGLLNEARARRPKDNTSIIYIDLDTFV